MTQKDEALKALIDQRLVIEVPNHILDLQTGREMHFDFAEQYALGILRKIGKAALSAEQVSLPDGWVAVEERLPNKVCLAYYKNELGNDRIVKAKFVKQFSEEANTDDDWIEYNDKDDTYYYPAGWYEMIDNWDDYAFVTINHKVTHWMPLPSAPKLNTKD